MRSFTSWIFQNTGRTARAFARPGMTAATMAFLGAVAVAVALPPASAAETAVFGLGARLEVVLGPDSPDAGDRWAQDAALASWRLAGGEWRSSGEVVGPLEPGPQLIEFAPIPGWDTPTIAQVVHLTPGDNRISATYRLRPTWTIGDIPPQGARHGDRLTFFVERPPEGRGGLWIEFPSGRPAGEVSFDPDSGAFTYEPHADDLLDFTVSFGAGGDVQDVTISPSPLLPAEQAVIQYEFPLPDPESRDYLNVTVRMVDATDPPFNHDPNLTELREVTVSGKTVVFRPGHPNALFERFARTDTSDVHDVRSLDVYAETVIIGGPFHLPQTDVTIHARELVFEDGNEIAFLSTTPLTPAKPLGNSGGESGADGLPAGDVTLHVRELSAPASDEPRLILRGGRGQDPEDGHDGANGNSCESLNNMTYYIYEVWVVCVFRVRAPEHDVHVLDQNCRPTSGKPAVAAATPGAGGRSGVLSAPFDLGAIADVSAGEAGARGRTYRGGRAGTPRSPTHGRQWVNADCITREPYEWEGRWRETALAPPRGDSYPTRHGADAVAPSAPDGESMALVLLESDASWLHPYWISSVVAHARDAYLGGNAGFASDVLAEYAAQIDAVLESGLPASLAGLERELEQERQEIESLVQRLDSGLDYFGNPPGWVPMLSFEANLQAYRNEIDAGIRTLYLTYWLGNRAMAIEDKSAALTEARAQAIARIEAMRTEYRETLASLPVLEAEWQSISARLEELEEELAELEEELRERAVNQVAERNRLSIFARGALIISGVLSLWPGVGKTVAGKGIERIALGGGSSDDVGEFFGSTYREGLEEFDELIDLLDSEAGGGDPIEIGQEVLRRAVVEPARKIHRGLSDKHAPIEEVEAELAAIRTYDPSFASLVDEVEDVAREKMLYAARLRQAVQSLSDLTSGIQQTKLAVLETTRALDTLLGAMDHATFVAIRKMERQVKDRLLWYQYLTAKSLEYRLLESYSRDPLSQLDLGRLLDRFVELGEVNPDEPARGFELDAEDFEALRAVYTAELSRITERFFRELNSNAPERSVPISFGLSDEELETLNTEGRVTINMAEKGIFGRSEENVRIIDLKTRTLRVSPRGGEYDDTALLRISFAHSGVSTLRSGGETYRFLHYRDSTSNPIVWRTVFDGIDESVTETTISAESESLLRVLLDDVGGGGEDLLLYSRPAADAEIVISREVRTNNNIDMVVNELRLQVEYGFYEKPESQVDLAVRAQRGLEPLVRIDTPDVNGRKHGRGSFARVFNRGASDVVVEAPPTYGLLEFEGWIDDAGEIVQADPMLSLRLEESTTVRPVYRSTRTRFVRGDANSDGATDLSDAVATLNFLFNGGAPASCRASADANGDGAVDIADPVRLLNFLFSGGPKPPPPFDSCGTDEQSTLSCESHAPCGTR